MAEKMDGGNYQAPQLQNQQPGAIPSMSVSGPGGNRNALSKPLDSQGQREWSYDVFDCFSDVGTFCLGWWCPCIVFSQNKSRLEHLNRNGTPHPQGGEAMGGDCLTYGGLAVCCGLGWILQIGTRSATRNRYQIHGDGVSDILCSWCCIPCALTQESREIGLEEQSLGGQA